MRLSGFLALSTWDILTCLHLCQWMQPVGYCLQNGRTVSGAPRDCLLVSEAPRDCLPVSGVPRGTGAGVGLGEKRSSRGVERARAGPRARREGGRGSERGRGLELGERAAEGASEDGALSSMRDDAARGRLVAAGGELGNTGEVVEGLDRRECRKA